MKIGEWLESIRIESMEKTAETWRDWYYIAIAWRILGREKRYQECIEKATDKYLES